MILLQLTEIVGLQINCNQTKMIFLLLLETHNCIRHNYVSDILIFCGSYDVKMDNQRKGPNKRAAAMYKIEQK